MLQGGLISGQPPAWLQQLIGPNTWLGDVINGLVYAYALAFWAFLFLLLVPLIRYFLGATPGMRSRALEEFIDRVTENIKAVLGIFIALVIIVFVIWGMANYAGVSTGYPSQAALLLAIIRDLLLQPIFNMAHAIFG
ncbi:hypothetical protein [Vulcanisaeta sp. JCM 16161]|uniref:hypothetical protein n=1 Tax=Vulcanisaeta sp. JCM 16161 TaxID=1295372 RepID=UPI00406D0510